MYLQDAVCALPSKPETDEALREVYENICSNGGSAHLFVATVLAPDIDESLHEEFRKAADDRLVTITGRLDATFEMLSGKVGLADLEVAEESLKRERVAYLRAQAINYIGGTKEAEVEARLKQLAQTLDSIRDAMLG